MNKITKTLGKVRNQLNEHKYNSASTNYAITADVTKLGKIGEILIFLDLASRAIVAHAYTSEHVTTEVVLDTIDLMLKQRSFLPPVKIIHTDRESLFKNDLYEIALAKYGIIVSRGSSEAFANQPINPKGLVS